MEGRLRNRINRIRAGGLPDSVRVGYPTPAPQTLSTCNNPSLRSLSPTCSVCATPTAAATTQPTKPRVPPTAAPARDLPEVVAATAQVVAAAVVQVVVGCRTRRSSRRTHTARGPIPLGQRGRHRARHVRAAHRDDPTLGMHRHHHTCRRLRRRHTAAARPRNTLGERRPAARAAGALPVLRVV